MASMGFPITVVTVLLLATGGALLLTPKDLLRSSIVADKPASEAAIEVAGMELLDLPYAEDRPVIQYASLTVEVTPLADLEPAAVVTPAIPENADIRFITAKILNMRTEPNKFAELVTSLPLGTRVTVSETSGTWALVTAPDGSTGWLSANFLATNGPAAD